MNIDHAASEDATTVAELYGIDFHDLVTEDDELDYEISDDLPVQRQLDFGGTGLYGRVD